MATINVIARSAKKDEDGTVPLYLRLSHRSRNRYLSLGYRLKETDWNPNKQKVRKSHPRHARLNGFLAEVKAESESALADLTAGPHPVTAGRLKDLVAEALSEDGEQLEGAQGPEADFVTFLNEELDGYRRRGQAGTHKTYQSIIRKFQTYLKEEHGREDLPYELIDVPLMEGFGTFCSDYFENAPNTVYKAMRTIRTFVRKAIKAGHLPQARNPFFQIELSGQKVRKEKLSLEEIRAIEALDLEEGALLWDVRNWFLFAFYGGGLRFSDLATLRNRHVRREEGRWRLAYQMDKTGGPAGSVLPQPGIQILTQYYDPQAGEEALVFNVLEGYDLSTPQKRRSAIESRNALANKYLKKIQEQADIDTHISFHLARHSIADYLRREDWSLYDISKLLRHSNISTTERYLAGFDRDRLDKKMEELF